MRYVGTVVVVGSCIEPVLKCGFLRKERDFQHGGVLGDAAMPSFRISYLPESLPSLVIKKNHFLRDTHTHTHLLAPPLHIQKVLKEKIWSGTLDIG